jgi:hypothetical protein
VTLGKRITRPISKPWATKVNCIARMSARSDQYFFDSNWLLLRPHPELHEATPSKIIASTSQLLFASRSSP